MSRVNRNFILLKHKQNQSSVNIIDNNKDKKPIIDNNIKINLDTDNKPIIDNNIKINLDTDKKPIIDNNIKINLDTDEDPIINNSKNIINDPTTIKYYNISNSKYSWENSSIIFLENGCMQAFGDGSYKQIDSYTFNANFGGRIHTLVFNNDFSEFVSTRYDDNQIVKGKKI
jgi:hypothetical protein